MLDTNTDSYVLKGLSAAARARLASLHQNEIACVSAITEAELWYGLALVGASAPRRNAMSSFLSRLQVLPWGRDEAAVYGAFRAKQESIGSPLGPLDTQIAAHAIAAHAILVSSDSGFKHAVGLPGLESWATDIIP